MSIQPRSRIGRRLWGAAVVVGLAALAGPALAECTIEGPTDVSVNESFTLCGPYGSAYAYEWHGPGVPTGTDSRCITVTGRAAGTYQYELTVWTNDQNPERCRRVVRVGSGGGGSMECAIQGPTTVRAGATAELCGPSSSVHSFRWAGPNGFSASTRCIRVSTEGVYDLTIRNVVTGFVRQCSHRLDVIGQGDDGDAGCAITGPRALPASGPARLCAETFTRASYRWTGPRGGFQGSSRCLNVTVPGTYRVTIRDLDGDWTQTCSFTIAGRVDDDDPDLPIAGNCPRGTSFWRQACRDRGTGREETAAELREIARQVDARSRYFNWSDDVAGFCQALSPSGPMTHRKNVARHFAALLANVVAGSMGLTAEDGREVGLDVDTEIQFRGSRTLAQLIAQVDQLLLARRGNYQQVAATLNGINAGRGIGPVCD